MPYIKLDSREQLTPICKSYPKSAGDLNFQVTCLLLDYLKYNGKSYQQINDILGALEGAKADFYRILAVSYEEQKIEENGDVYPGE
mgnify:CR=1 FL=1